MSEQILLVAHKRNAYRILAIVSFLATTLNLAGIGIADFRFHFLQNWISQFSILVVPIFALLLLPAFLVSIFFNKKTAKKFRVVLDDERFFIQTDSSKKEESFYFTWKEITGYHFIDFEDNHYFSFEVNGKKSDWILHRDSVDFDFFLENLLKKTAVNFTQE